MASLLRYIMLSLILAWLFVMPSLAQGILLPKYTTVGICDEVCQLHPETDCRLDCLVVTPDKEYNDCIHHFYYSNGTIEYHCDWN